MVHVWYSATLALPGPEEKRVVPSDASNATHIPPPPPVINSPMSLPPSENNFSNDAIPEAGTCRVNNK